MHASLSNLALSLASMELQEKQRGEQRIYQLIRDQQHVISTASDAVANAATTSMGPSSIATTAGTSGASPQPSAKKISSKRRASQGPESLSSAKRAKTDKEDDSEHVKDEEDVKT
ncbi:MAG: hypothetical protein Q9209_001293 [Squamulea sp. 1 TL-2023]